jgi:predicted O-methyltransferase YrrM
MAAYKFEFDWFSSNIPSFEKHLGHLKGMPCSLLEIGCHEGRSSTWLLEKIASNKAARLLCLDLYEQPSFWANIRAAQGEARTELKLGLSREILRTLPLTTYDFIYIDGSHSTVDVLEDAVLSFRLAKAGSIIAFDDYLWDDPEFNQHGVPKPAVDAFCEIYSEKIDVLEFGSQVWIRKRVD